MTPNEAFTAYSDRARECGIPEHCIEPLVDYVVRGWEPGGFLYEVLCNRLVGALQLADDANRDALPAYARFLYTHAPRWCWKGPDEVADWIKRSGLMPSLETTTEAVQ